MQDGFAYRTVLYMSRHVCMQCQSVSMKLICRDDPLSRWKRSMFEFGATEDKQMDDLVLLDTINNSGIL